MNLQRITIAANFTAEPILSSMQLLLEKLGIPSTVVFAPYNQVFQQLLDSASPLNSNSQGVNIILLRVEDLIDGKASNFKYGSDELEAITANAIELERVLQSKKNLSVPLFMFLCPLSESISSDPALAARIAEIERSLVGCTDALANVFVFTTEHIARRYSIKTWNNQKGNSLGHVPYNEEFFSALGAEVVRKIDARFRKPYKVIVLDCDNTLWDGVCGEDGTDGVAFGESHLFLQRLMVEQSRAGMLICLCSKNNEDDVWDVFDRRTEMPLKREHVVTSRINWSPKSANLKSLAGELRLGLESFIFIDDDPAVCAEVGANCPQVLTLQVPAPITELPRLLDQVWVFDRLNITEEDRQRTASYQREGERITLQSQSSDFSTFLESLKLVCNISPIRDEQISRVSQLSMRTNQFNSTTIRRSESEVHALVSDSRKHILTITVKDRFGDYGLTGTVAFSETMDAIDVDSFMLSCRVLGRGVEHTVLRELGKIGSQAGKAFVNIQYRSSEKNVPFLNFMNEVADGHKAVDNEVMVYLIPVELAAAARPNMGISPVSLPSDNAKSAETAKTDDYMPSPDVYLEIARTLAWPNSKNFVNASIVTRSKLTSEFVGACTQTEISLMAIWQRLLKLDGVGVHDDYFELGGDSLAAVSLFVEIEEEFGVELPLTSLIEFPTIKKLATIIDGDSPSAEWKYLVPIRTEGTRPPLFCMHAAGGNVLFYRDLANELDRNQPVYGLQARGVANKAETAHDRVEDMAREYLEEIRQLQPNGPYRLCGSSFGGLVAFEAARQLLEVGEKVEILSLFDTYAPGYLRSAKDDRGILNNSLLRMRALKQQLAEIETTRERLGFFVSKVKKLRTRFKRKAAWKKNEFDVEYRKAMGKALPVDIQRNHKAIQRALESYQPHMYRGEVVLFRAADQPKHSAFDEYLGWRAYTDRPIVAREVKGTHGALTVYPFAGGLARRLNTFLVGQDSNGKSLFSNDLHVENT